MKIETDQVELEGTRNGRARVAILKTYLENEHGKHESNIFSKSKISALVARRFFFRGGLSEFADGRREGQNFRRGRGS